MTSGFLRMAPLGAKDSAPRDVQEKEERCWTNYCTRPHESQPIRSASIRTNPPNGC